MEELNAYKYNSISYIRMTYDDIVSKIKNLRLTPHIMQTLTILLDDLEQVPIIVRSSSLLEDRSQSAFSGKYKSLYLSNQGTKKERLDALADAILEVYSSQYNPDSFQYREKRHLLHVSEKMGVLIQEVVGTKIGPYYMPLFAGVAFSENAISWSPRIRRESGLVRMVMGLGTRAVDRVNNDYSLLFSPENPGFKINQNPNDVLHYSQKYIDVMNLESSAFETVEVEHLLKTWGHEIPKLSKLVSVYHDEYMQKKNFIDLSPKKDKMVITFDGILMDTDFPKKLSRILTVLKEKMGIQVDIEFAYDGSDLILLQCRTLNQGFYKEAATIPEDISDSDILFTANRYVSNGKIENLRYIVYVDGDAYSNLASKSEMLSVGEAVGKLNMHLPLKKYLLMGPGRWGSRGDIQLGVRVTYADICNTAMLIEVAKKKQSYVPEVSFGTHFFQDLVESNIAYLPCMNNASCQAELRGHQDTYRGVWKAEFESLISWLLDKCQYQEDKEAIEKYADSVYQMADSGYDIILTDWMYNYELPPNDNERVYSGNSTRSELNQATGEVYRNASMHLINQCYGYSFRDIDYSKEHYE